MSKFNARELVQIIATATIGLALLLIVGGLIAMILQLHDGEQTAAMQNTLMWLLLPLAGGLAGLAGIAHFGGDSSTPPPAPVSTPVPIPVSIPVSLPAAAPAPTPAPAPAPAAGDPPSGAEA